MELVSQYIITGILTGGIYALLALSIVLVYKSTSVINFAVGNMAMVASYICWSSLVQLEFPAWLSIPLAIGIAALIGMGVERLFLRPLIGQPILASMMVTLGLLLFFYGVANLVWGSLWHPYPKLISVEPLYLFGVSISRMHLLAFCIGLALLGILSYFFYRTRAGLNMRAVAEGQDLARSAGVNVKRVFSQAWALAAVVGAIAGILLAMITTLTLDIGELGLKAFPVIILGGLDSILGAVVGGIIIGVLENLSGAFLDPIFGGGVKEVAPYAIMLLVLLFKPYGLFGLVRIERI